MVISNLAAFDAAIRAVCPDIDGVGGDGTIYFQANATAAERSAAARAAASYVDPPPPLVSNLEQLVTELEMAGVLSAAAIGRIRQPRHDPPVTPPPHPA